MFLPRLTWTVILLFYASCGSWDDMHVQQCPAFSTEMVSHRNFCPDWPGTMILPISVSQVARIIGISHQQLVGTRSSSHFHL
jgi:hypothetical protein